MLLQHSNQLNYLGIWTLYYREVKRFLVIPGQTLFAPAVSIALFIAVFTLSLRPSIQLAGLGEFPMILFVVPGLVIMNVLQGSFDNNSVSILLAKTYGNIFDLLVSPLSPSEVIFATTAAGITRGIILASITLITANLLVGLDFHSYIFLVLFVCLGSGCMALVGTISGIWAENFEKLSLIAQLIIMPLTFLSGTFYPISSLPEQLQPILMFNPIFHAINGFRYAVIGYTDVQLELSIAVLGLVLAGLWFCAYAVLKSGYKLRS